MQTKVLLTKKEFTWSMQQAELINNGELREDDVIALTLDDNRIAVDVPNMVRSMQRKVEVDKDSRSFGKAISEPGGIYDLEVPGKD